MITETAIGNKNHQDALDVVERFKANGGKVEVIPSNARSKVAHKSLTSEPKTRVKRKIRDLA